MTPHVGVGVTVETMIVVMAVDVEAEEDDEVDGGSTVDEVVLVDALDVDALLLGASVDEPETAIARDPASGGSLSNGGPMQAERKRRGQNLMLLLPPQTLR